MRALFRRLRRLTVASLRATERAARFIGQRPWKIDKFNRLIQQDVQEIVRRVRSARVVVGIPFHREHHNIAALAETTLRDLEARGQDAVIAIAGERKTRALLLETALPKSSSRVHIVALQAFWVCAAPGTDAAVVVALVHSAHCEPPSRGRGFHRCRCP